MKIELEDVDTTYTVKDEMSADGKTYITITALEIDGNNGIVLNEEQCQELIRVLQFISNEIKRR